MTTVQIDLITVFRLLRKGTEIRNKVSSKDIDPEVNCNANSSSGSHDMSSRTKKGDENFQACGDSGLKPLETKKTGLRSLFLSKTRGLDAIKQQFSCVFVFKMTLLVLSKSSNRKVL